MYKHPYFKQCIPAALVTSVLFVAGCGGSDGGSAVEEAGNNDQSVIDQELSAGQLRQIANDSDFVEMMRSSVANSAMSGGAQGSSGFASSIAIAPPSNSNSQFDGRDLMKTDGQYLFVLEGTAVDVGGESDPQQNVAENTGDGTPDGGDTETNGDQNIQPAVQVSVYALDDRSTSSSRTTGVVVETGQDKFLGMHYIELGNEKSLIVETGESDHWNNWATSGWFAQQQSGLHKVDVSDPNNPVLTESLIIGGQTVASKIVGDTLYFVNRFYPQVSGSNIVDISDVAPMIERSSDGSMRSLINAEDCFAVNPQQGAPDQLSGDLVTVAAIDLNSMDVVDSGCYLGASETVYISDSAIYIANALRKSTGSDVTVTDDVGNSVATGVDGSASSVDGGSTTSVRYADTRTETVVHKFSVSGSAIDYVASGSVSGHLGWTYAEMSSRLNEKDGDLRVATYTSNDSGSELRTNVSVLRVNGGSLDQMGQASVQVGLQDDNAADVTQASQATRFIGNKLYWGVFDGQSAFQAVDLSNPAAPSFSVEGRFSGTVEQVYQLDGSYLLTAGKEYKTEGGANYSQGIQLSLIDVSGGGGPELIDSVTIGQRGTDSIALVDYRGVSITPASEGNPHRVALGINVAGENIPPEGAGLANIQQWTYSGLHGFNVHTGNSPRIEVVGALVAEVADGSVLSVPNPAIHNDRSVLVNDTVYYRHGESIFSRAWSELTNLDSL